MDLTENWGCFYFGEIQDPYITAPGAKGPSPDTSTPDSGRSQSPGLASLRSQAVPEADSLQSKACVRRPGTRASFGSCRLIAQDLQWKKPVGATKPARLHSHSTPSALNSVKYLN